MDKFTNQILSFIRSGNLICRGDRVVVGLSGGADSVCLLHVLSALYHVIGLSGLAAVHVNHGLRGEEARRDEQFCRELTEDLGIPFRAVSADVKRFARENGMSPEEAGRVRRYEILEEIRQAYEKTGVFPGEIVDETADRAAGKSANEAADGSERETAGAVTETEKKMENRDAVPAASVKIAAAHHADDQAETILLNLLRGTGLRGLSGMEAARGVLVRPLLCVSRKEILAWMKKKGFAYVTDSTNLSDDYTRNFLRNRILPELSESVNARAAQHILSAGAICAQADAYLRAEAGAFLQEYAELRMGDRGGGKSLAIPKRILKEKPQIFRRYVIIEALHRLGVPLKDFAEPHFADLDKAISAGKGFHVDLPGAAFAENESRETVIYFGKL